VRGSDPRTEGLEGPEGTINLAFPPDIFEYLTPTYDRMSLQRVQPIIPTSRKEPFDDPDWLFDLKYDGFRAVSYFERGSCRFVSRRGNVFTRSTRCAGQVASALCEKRRSRAGSHMSSRSAEQNIEWTEIGEALRTK